MEKSENRWKFMQSFDEVLKRFDLSGHELQTSIIRLISHPYFTCYAKPLSALNGNETAQKVFILTELTKERFTCNCIIQMLRQWHRYEAADLLAIFNISTGPVPLSNDIEIPIAIGLSIKDSSLSNTYALHRRPRGKCVIINNVELRQNPPYFDQIIKQQVLPIGLQRETQRLKYMFGRLYFEIEDLSHMRLSAIKMREELIRISKNVSEKDDAFVLIVVSHGQNEVVLGYDACEAVRELRCGDIQPTDVSYQNAVENDQVQIKELISIFSEENCPQLSNKPKLHFFNCCRIDENRIQCNQTGSGDQAMDVDLVVENRLEASQIQNGVNRHDLNLDTFVCYSCAQGYMTFFDNYYGMSYFGQAFTHSIAQYACDESLMDIMGRTSTRLTQMYQERGIRREALGCFAIEVNTFRLNKCIYLNPGYFDQK